MLGILKEIIGKRVRNTALSMANTDASVYKYTLIANTALNTKNIEAYTTELKQDIKDFCEKHEYTSEDLESVEIISQLAFFRLSKVSKLYTIEKTSGDKKQLKELKKRAEQYLKEYKTVKALV